MKEEERQIQYSCINIHCLSCTDFTKFIIYKISCVIRFYKIEVKISSKLLIL